MMRRLAVLLVLAGCGGAEGPEPWSGRVETLPGGAVRVSNPAQGTWSEASAWRPVPELRLGEEDGAAALTFASISGVEADDAGRIYVLDRHASELRIFGGDGTHLRTVGRRGRGPGEYTGANGLRWLAPDSLLVVDQQGARYSVLTREGAFVRSVPRTLGFFGWMFRGGSEGGRVLELGSVGEGESQRPVLLATPLAGPAGAAPPAVDTLPLPVAGPGREEFSVRSPRGSMFMGIPFSPAPVYHLDGRGGVWHGHGSAFRLVRTTLAGDTTLEISMDATPAPVAPAERDEWLAGEHVKRFREMGGELDPARIPTTKPFFDAVYVDPDGYVWASIPAALTETVFAVFHPDGRYLGRLHVEGVKRDAFLPPVVRNGRLYLVGTDESDVPRVYVFRIEGRPAAGA